MKVKFVLNGESQKKKTRPIERILFVSICYLAGTFFNNAFASVTRVSLLLVIIYLPVTHLNEQVLERH